ncbi:hypothetical protein B0H34DRAFT_801169 [Crassisporium funariophilum]|nr:hypothetical protein B0H34DRAFT_801169 [Crassisporium funariophilum]
MVSITLATGHSPTSKVAGSRQPKHERHQEPSASTSKAKGKRKQHDVSDFEDASDMSEPTAKHHGGHQQGAGNYKEEELKQLLDLTEKELPQVWATKNKKPIWDAKALKHKFKALVKTKNLTGEAKRPESVTRAKAIDRLIVEKSGTVNIQDDDNNYSNNNQSNASDADPYQSNKVHTIITCTNRSESIQPRRTRGGQTTELVHKIAHALDPGAQHACDEDCANHSLQNTQVFILVQQLCDALATVESLCKENGTIRDRLSEDGWFAQEGAWTSRSQTWAQVQAQAQSTPYGGQQTLWITDGSSASDWDNHNKENQAPSAHRVHGYPVRSPSPICLPSPIPTLKPQHCKRLSFSSYQPYNFETSPLPPSRVFLDASPLKAGACGGISTSHISSPSQLQVSSKKPI